MLTGTWDVGCGMWLSCNGDLLATEECASSSVANTFVAPTLQLILGCTISRLLAQAVT